MSPLDRVMAAVSTFRGTPIHSDDERHAALVAADACEEAGLDVDAAWYRFAAADGLGDRPEGDAKVWATPPDELDKVIARLKRCPARGEGDER